MRFIPHDEIHAAIKSNVRLGDALWKITLIDAAVLAEWIANVGRRTAIERVAHLLCECLSRMHALGLAKVDAFDLPLTQLEIGDATGLSNVHVNRTMQELRRLRLIRTDASVHTILDWPTLKEVADFQPDYLHLRPSPAP